jgi:hypothetical protein
MKYRVLIFLLIPVLSYAEPDLSGMLRLTNGSGLAHACPTSMDRAFTNRHVVQGGTQWIWGTGDGELSHGIAEVEGLASQIRDLAVVKPISEMRFPHWYPLAKEAPKVGDKVYFVGYEFKNEKEAFGPKRFTGVVTRLFNGHLIFKSNGQPGSSGSCVLNEAGETVAINQGGRTTENNGQAGLGVGVWGNWLTLKPDEPPVVEPSPYEGIE